MEGLHIFNFEILISEKISWTVHRMHTHMEMLLPTCRPHFQGKEGPAPHLREKGQRHQGLTAFFKEVSYFQSIRSSLPSSLPESWGTRSKRRGSQTPGAPHTSDRQRVRRANLFSSGSSSLVQVAPQPCQFRVYSTKCHCLDFFSGWTWGRWRGQKLQHKMPSFQQVPLCMKREGKKEGNEKA